MTTKKLNIQESVTPAETPATEVLALTSDRKAAAKERLARCMKEESRMVKGIFKFFECPGMNAKIIVKKYKEIPVFEKEMIDGQEYEIPLYVANHLNGIDITAEAIGGKLGTCSYALNSYLMDKNGVPIVTAEKRKHRFGFHSLNFGAQTVA